MQLVLFLASSALQYPFTKCNLPANVNFDPLGLSRTDLTYKRFFSPEPRDAMDILNDYREAEIKHGRLAMLAAVAYPIQEVFQPILARQLELPSMLSDGNLSPSVINGHLDPSIVIWLVGLGSGLELGRMMSPESAVLGDYGWGRVVTPRATAPSLFRLQAGEMWNGRIAMVAILAYVVQEALTKTPVLMAIG